MDMAIQAMESRRIMRVVETDLVTRANVIAHDVSASTTKMTRPSAPTPDSPAGAATAGGAIAVRGTTCFAGVWLPPSPRRRRGEGWGGGIAVGGTPSPALPLLRRGREEGCTLASRLDGGPRRIARSDRRSEERRVGKECRSRG